MCTVWHVDKYKITFKLVINSRRISRGPVSGRGPVVEKHSFRQILTKLESGRKKAVKSVIYIHFHGNTSNVSRDVSRRRPDLQTWRGCRFSQPFFMKKSQNKVGFWRHCTVHIRHNFKQRPIFMELDRKKRPLEETSKPFVSISCINPLTPNDLYSSRTAPLTSKRCILYIYSTNIGTEYFKHGINSPLFSSSKCSLFHNSNVFGSCIIHILYTGVLKF